MEVVPSLKVQKRVSDLNPAAYLLCGVPATFPPWGLIPQPLKWKCWHLIFFLACVLLTYH